MKTQFSALPIGSMFIFRDAVCLKLTEKMAKMIDPSQTLKMTPQTIVEVAA